MMLSRLILNNDDDDSIVSKLFTQEAVHVLRSNDISVIRRVARALTTPHVLVKKLCLCGGLRLAGADAICSALESNSTLEELSFQSDLEAGCVAALRHGISVNSTLKKLEFIGCGIGSEDAVELGRALHVNTSIEKFWLCGNPAMGDAGAHALVDSLERGNTTLKELNLWKCDISSFVAEALGRYLKENHTLEELDLRNNKSIGNDGALP
jgi:hypothetical protein